MRDDDSDDAVALTDARARAGRQPVETISQKQSNPALDPSKLHVIRPRRPPCRFEGRVSCVVFDGCLLWPELAIRVGRNECAFTGNDFSRAQLKSVDFRNIDLAAQVLPDGFSAST